MDPKGKLLVTTKNSPATNVLYWVLGLVFLFLGLFVMLSDTMSDFFLEMGWDLFGSLRAGGVIQVIFLILCLMVTVAAFASSWSYCEVYENTVKGTTRLSMTKGLRKFELSYRDVVNATVSGKKITIHTVAGSYEAMATSNRMEAMQAIQARIAQAKQSSRN